MLPSNVIQVIKQYENIFTENRKNTKDKKKEYGNVFYKHTDLKKIVISNSLKGEQEVLIYDKEFDDPTPVGIDRILNPDDENKPKVDVRLLTLAGLYHVHPIKTGNIDGKIYSDGNPFSIGDCKAIRKAIIDDKYYARAYFRYADMINYMDKKWEIQTDLFSIVDDLSPNGGRYVGLIEDVKKFKQYHVKIFNTINNYNLEGENIGESHRKMYKAAFFKGCGMGIYFAGKVGETYPTMLKRL